MPENYGHCWYQNILCNHDDDDCMGVPYARQGHHGKASANILLQIAAVIIIMIIMIIIMIKMIDIPVPIIGIILITMMVVIIIMDARQRGEDGGG